MGMYFLGHRIFLSWFTFSGPSDVVTCPNSASALLLFSSAKPFGRRAVSLDEKEVTEEGEEVFSVWARVIGFTFKVLGASGTVGESCSTMMPSYMKSEESSLESGSGITPLNILQGKCAHRLIPST